jgi:uncharacterized protein (DUF1778 family)
VTGTKEDQDVKRTGKHTPRRHVRIPERTWDLLNEAAEAGDITVSELIRDGAEREAKRLLRENRDRDV